MGKLTIKLSQLNFIKDYFIKFISCLKHFKTYLNKFKIVSLH